MKKAWIILLMFCALARGQEVNEASGLRVLALGDLPPHREKIVDGERVKIVSPFELPPEIIEIQGSGGADLEADLRLKRMTRRIEVPGGNQVLSIKRKDQQSTEAWLELELPFTGEYLAVVTHKEPEKRDWREVEAHLLVESQDNFPSGHIRFLNTSQRTIAVILGEERAFSIKPGETVIRKAPGEQFEMIIAQKNEQEAWKAFFRKEVNVKRDARFNVFAYDANGSEPRYPVRIFMSPNFEDGGGFASGNESSVEEDAVVGLEATSVDAPDDKNGESELSQSGEETGDSIALEGEVGRENSMGGDLTVDHLTGEKKIIVIRNHGEGSGGGAGEMEKFRLDVVLPLVLLILFVFLMIRYGIRWDAFARKPKE